MACKGIRYNHLHEGYKVPKNGVFWYKNVDFHILKMVEESRMEHQIMAKNMIDHYEHQHSFRNVVGAQDKLSKSEKWNFQDFVEVLKSLEKLQLGANASI